MLRQPVSYELLTPNKKRQLDLGLVIEVPCDPSETISSNPSTSSASESTFHSMPDTSLYALPTRPSELDTANSMYNGKEDKEEIVEGNKQSTYTPPNCE